MPLFLPPLLLPPSQHRPGNLPPRIDLTNAEDPRPVNRHLFRPTLPRRILYIIAEHGVGDKVGCAVRPGVEFCPHQPGRDVVLEVVVAGAAEHHQQMLLICIFLCLNYIPRRRMFQRYSLIVTSFVIIIMNMITNFPPPRSLRRRIRRFNRSSGIMEPVHSISKSPTSEYLSFLD